MLTLANITNTQYDTERFSDGGEMRTFCKELLLDGFELLPFFGNDTKTIPADMVRGVHLSYQPCWLDFWIGNEAGVAEEFGDGQTARERLGSREAIIQAYRNQLDWAEELGAEYAVFHVSDVSLAETMTYRFRHTDDAVIAATLEMLSAIFAGKNYRLAFLVENLWWPGFTFTNPEITRALIDGIPCENKGVMLDMGHLLHTNLDLSTQEEGVSYIRDMLDRHGTLARSVRGLHLNQSMTGEYVKRLIAHPPTLTGSYSERLGQAYEHILAIDAHLPFTGAGIKELVEELSPEYLTYEFITTDSAQHAAFIRTQNAALGRGKES